MKYSQDEIEDLLKNIPQQEGASSSPDIFDVVQQLYSQTKTNDLLSGGQGASLNTKSAASSLGRGGTTYQDEPSSPLSTDEEYPPMDKLKQLMQRGPNGGT
jgi:hypothetical protein